MRLHRCFGVSSAREDGIKDSLIPTLFTVPAAMLEFRLAVRVSKLSGHESSLTPSLFVILGSVSSWDRDVRSMPACYGAQRTQCRIAILILCVQHVFALFVLQKYLAALHCCRLRRGFSRIRIECDFHPRWRVFTAHIRTVLPAESTCRFG